MAKASIESAKKKIKFRPPIVTVMGHIDHGKTTLLDSIRGTDITAKEYGGITQHIGAYQIEFTPKDSPKEKRKITFIDTPGHEAFSLMRARGGQISDLVVLVVAANEGVKQQTLEAIDHAKAANVPIIVAINKVDLKTANEERVKKQLAEAGLMVEEWGGDSVAVSVSAKTKAGIDELLEMILLVADLLELKSLGEAPLKAVIIEFHLSSKRGVVASVIVKEGALKVGDIVQLEGISGKVRALTDWRGESVKKVLPGDPAELLGLKSLPAVGSILIGSRVSTRKMEKPRTELSGSTEAVLRKNQEKEIKSLNLIVKSDTQGTLQAILGALSKLENEEVKIKVLSGGVGNITDSDVLLAAPSRAHILGFNVQFSSETENLAKSLGVGIKKYKIIYDLLKDTAELMKGATGIEEFAGKGKAEILKLFPLPSGDIVVGAKVRLGKIKEGDVVFISRNEEEVHRGKIKSLKVDKARAKSVSAGSECGILIKPQFAFLVQDVIEVK